MDLKELAGSKRRAISDLICTGLGSLEAGGITFFSLVTMVSVAARRASGKSGYEHLSIPQTTFLPSCLSQGAQVMGRYVCLLPDPLSK